MPSPTADPSLSPPRILQSVEQALPIDQIFPVAPLLLGGAVLVGIVLIHGVLMRFAQERASRAGMRISGLSLSWRIEVVMISIAFTLLAASLLEVVVWTAVLKYAGIFATWSAAAAYAATMYTTLGNVLVPPPPGWHMLGPIIAISGLFTFGWSGSVLVDVVGRLGRARDQARAGTAARAGGGPTPASGAPATG